jgi:hypothetical protein
MVKISCGKGGENLSESDRQLIDSLAEECLAKIKRSLKEVISFDVHLKCFEKQGNVKRYNVNVRLVAPKHNFDVSAENWVLHDAVKETMQKILNEIESKCHASDSHGIGKRGKC